MKKILCPECGGNELGIHLNNRWFCIRCGYIFEVKEELYG